MNVFMWIYGIEDVYTLTINILNMTGFHWRGILFILKSEIYVGWRVGGFVSGLITWGLTFHPSLHICSKCTAKLGIDEIGDYSQLYVPQKLKKMFCSVLLKKKKFPPDVLLSATTPSFPLFFRLIFSQKCKYPPCRFGYSFNGSCWVYLEANVWFMNIFPAFFFESFPTLAVMDNTFLLQLCPKSRLYRVCIIFFYVQCLREKSILYV